MEILTFATATDESVVAAHATELTLGSEFRDHHGRHLRQNFATGDPKRKRSHPATYLLANIIAVIANGLPIGSPLVQFGLSLGLGGGGLHDPEEEADHLGNFACHHPSPIANGLLIYAFSVVGSGGWPL